MIRIDIKYNKLTIDLKNEKLSSSNIFQLKLRGVEVFEKNKLISNEDRTQSLLKVIEYFDNEGIKYNLSKTSKEILKAQNDQKKLLSLAMQEGKSFKEGKVDKKSFDEYRKYVQKNIKRPLKDHQIKASYHYFLVKNGANFSVPGSGKTAVVLSVFEKLRQNKEIEAIFVVGPPSCFGSWKEEYKNVFGVAPKTKIFAGGKKAERKVAYYSYLNKIDMYLTTFQTLLNDQDEVNSLLKRLNNKVMLVIDEAHYIKQIDGSWAKAVLSVAKNAKYRSVLTGTPIPRSYLDLFNLFEFLWPGQESLSAREKIQLEIYEKEKEFDKAAKLLDPKLGPLFYRVRKTDLGLTEPIIHPTTMVKMNTYERKIYDLLISKFSELSEKDYSKNSLTLKELKKGRMTRLRQALSYPKLLITGIPGYREDFIGDKDDIRNMIYNYDQFEQPEKILKLVELTEKYLKNKQKVLIWSNFLGTIELIEKTLEAKGHYVKKITGGVPVEKENIKDEETREKIRNEFLDPGSGLDILIANPAACAESISLHTTCHHAIYYDLSYNCAQYLQSLDRIHRVGASEHLFAHYDFLQYKQTVEPEILTNLKNKAKKMSDLIDTDYSIYSLNMFDNEDDEKIYDSIFKK